MVTSYQTLLRIRFWLARKGHPVQGNKFIHALESLSKPDPHPTLDAGWPNPEKKR